MRLALAVLLLVGCAVGQQAGSNTFPASREKCLEAVQKHWISADMCSVYGPRGAKPGDCYRVKHDGTLEKVETCGNPPTRYMWCDDGVVRYTPIPKDYKPKLDGGKPCKVP